MAGVRPFAAVRYQTARFPDLASVLAPPYDVIRPDEQQALYARDPYNVIRLEYGLQSADDSATDNRYTRAQETLRAWLDDAVLTTEAAPALYPHAQRYTRNAASYTRTGFFAAVELQRFDEGAILPHEWTLKGPKVDRLQLMQTCLTCFSPVFGLYDGRHSALGDALAAVRRATPLATASGHGFDETLWRADDPGLLAAVQEAFTAQQILIADGHHRYETLLALRDILRAAYPDAPATAAFNHALMLLVDVHDPGLLILPTHRLLRLTPAMLDGYCLSADDRFRVEPLALTDPSQVTEVLAQQHDAHAFIWYHRGRYTLLTAPKTARNGLPLLDVQILQEWIIDRLFARDPEAGATVESHVRYAVPPADAVARVDADEAPVAVFLNPTPVEDVFTLAAAGVRLPQKSTYFYPKIPTGLVMHRLARPGGIITVGA